MHLLNYCKTFKTIFPEDDTTLPPWLQDLLTCSCCVQNFHLQTNAIGSVLDLIILTQSVQSETLNKSKDCGRRSVSEGRVSVVILPALLPRHLQYINDKTIFYQVGLLFIICFVFLFKVILGYVLVL